jgi:hypothetical protein
MKAFKTFVVFAFVVAAATGRADLFSTYELTGNTFTVPTSAYTSSGGLLHYFDNGTIYRQDSLNSAGFTAVGHLGSGFSVNSFPAFLEFSPDGSRVAIGNSGGSDFSTYQVAVFDASALGASNPDLSPSASIYAVNHNAAVWADNRNLLLTAGVFGQPSEVTCLDTLSPTGSPANGTVVGNIGGASAGVALDASGRLFTGNGFDGAGASDTGWVKAISPSAWQTSPPADFENGPGSLFVVDLLSAGSLHFDTEGNLLIGGGDFGGSGDLNYFALVSGAAINNLILYGTPINTGDPAQVRKLDPSAASSFYTLAVDRDHNFFYALDGTTAYQYCAIPEPSTWMLLIVGGVAILWRGCRRKTAALLAIGFALATAGSVRADQFFAEQIVNFSPGTGITEGVGFGVTSRVLGGPRGEGAVQATTDVLTLGETGSVTLGFGGKWIEDGSGFDFIVFENPILVGGTGNTVYGELFFVEVSTDGANFARFESLSLNPNPIPAFGTMDRTLVSGLGGTEPGFANVDTNTIDPFDATVAGGNAFDLSSLSGNSLVTGGLVNLSQIRYVRLIDIKGDGLTLDSSGNPIYDPLGVDIFGNPMAADVDALSVIHGIPEPATITLYAVALMMGALLSRRRK